MFYNTKCDVGQDSSVGIASCYGLGIKSQWGARFSACVQFVPGAHWDCYKMGAGSLPSNKVAWVWGWPPTPI